jgi:eukaryotic-like serine/threonine-protein kinase
MHSGLGIDAATWARLSPLLDAALDLPPAERDAWLAALPAEHAELKPAIAALLARAAHAPGRSIETLPSLDDVATSPAGAPGAHAAGDLIGPYRLKRELGAGGMGEVWLAERADGLIQRVVALKLPYGPFRADLAARIAREREFLAALDHPHIARLYDAGVTPDGQPYLALEHVDGQHIHHYAAARGLGLQARLRLFLQVARAVAHAHAQLIVHRDLKPSNLLVDAAGQVKLLDFGIARLLDDGGPSELTQQGLRALTPDYASPEQIAGQPVGTRSDVYALGVLLFELLTGARPYRLKRDSRAALEDAILAADVPRPSESVADRSLRRGLRGDLDTIVLKALKKPVAERYASVDALAQDIERHLSMRPVLARPDSAWYRARRFVVRNRIAVATAAALLTTVLGGAGAALWQARVAVAERQRAEDVKNFVAAIFREANPYDGSGKQALSAIDLLKQAQRRLDAALAGQGSARIELSNMIGESLLALGDIAAAEPVIARAVAEAEASLAPDDAQTLRGLMLQSQVDRLRGRPQQARLALDRVIPALRARPGDMSADLATALAHRTLTAIELGAYAEAEGYAREGAEISLARLGEHHPQSVASAVLLSLAYRYTKKFDAARTSGERAYRLAIAVHGEAAPHPRVIEARSVYARALGDTGDLVQGTAMLAAAVTDARALLGPDNAQAGVLVQNIVDYRLDLGEIELADANAAEALDILGRTLAPDSMAYALTVHTRALAHLARRDARAAQATAAQATATIDKLVGPGHEAAAAARTTLGLALMLDGQLEAAGREFDAVVPRLAALPPTSALPARVALARGTLARLRGDRVSALQHLQPLASSTNPAPKWQRERMRAWAQIGLVRLEQGEPAQAIEALDTALAEFARLETRVTPARAEAVVALDRARLAQGERAK